mmetsp:Transcript_45662/g.81657  ORF Transcript_45662/g.81657 Transcript_45662/m.81657 type:complete len:84 (+) Transcript_45662:369-620(+)
MDPFAAVHLKTQLPRPKGGLPTLYSTSGQAHAACSPYRASPTPQSWAPLVHYDKKQGSWAGLARIRTMPKKGYLSLSTQQVSE